MASNRIPGFRDLALCMPSKATAVRRAIKPLAGLSAKEIHLWMLTEYIRIYEETCNDEMLHAADPDIQFKLQQDNLAQQERVLDKMRAVSKDLLSYDAAIKRGDGARGSTPNDPLLDYLRKMDGKALVPPAGEEPEYELRKAEA